MDKVNVYFDCDSVLVDSIQTICTLYELDTGIYVDPNTVTRWDFQDVFTEWTANDVEKAFSSLDFWDYTLVNDGFEEMLEKLSKDDRFNLIMVSNGSRRNMRNKEKFIEDNLPYFDMYLNPTFPKKDGEVKFLSDAKKHVNMHGDCFIDDCVKNLKMSNALLKLCYADRGSGKEWNECDDSFKYVECTSTEDIIREIQTFYELVYS